MNSIKKLADAVYNDLVSGLRGYHQNVSISLLQLEEEIVQTRLLVIKEYMVKGILPIKDLLFSLNCIPVDCDTLDKCKCNSIACSKPTAHFQIPLLLLDFGLNKAIQYIGSSDKQHSFLVYTKPVELIKTYHKYRKRGKLKPWVFVDVAPNSEGLIDCYIFGAPLIKQVSVTAVFKDPRQLEEYNCNCDGSENDGDSNFNFLDILIKERLLLLKFRYYRQYQVPLKPNTQEYTTG